jgi:hypothetical protein
MKYLLSIYLLLPCLLIAQVPQGFTYQAVATDNNGLELVEQNVSVRVSILSESSTGVEQWIEVHSTTTDGFGLFTITIGEGTSTGNGAQSSFSDIDWGGSEHYLKIEMDVNGSSEYQLLGTSQLMSVPYALHAGTSDQGDSQSEQIDSLETIIQELTNTVNSVSSGITSTNSNGNIVSLCDIGYSGDTIMILGEDIYPNQVIYIKEIEVTENAIYVAYELGYQSNGQYDIYDVNSTINQNGERQIILVKYDLNGNVQWQRTTNTSTSYQMFGGLAVNETDIFICIFNENSNVYFLEDLSTQSESNDSHIFRLNNDGDVINSFSSGTIKDIAIDQESIYYTSGNTLNKRTYTFQSEGSTELETAQGHYLSINPNTGLIYVFSTGSSSNQVNCFTSGLNLLWGQGFSDNGNDLTFEEGEDFFMGDDLLMYNQPDYPIDANEDASSFYLIDSNGNNIWTMSTELDSDDNNHTPYIRYICYENKAHVFTIPSYPSPEDVEYLINDIIYNGDEGLEIDFDNNKNTLSYNEVYRSMHYYYNNFLLEKIDNQSYFSLHVAHKTFCFNDQLYPGGKIYLMKHSF